MLIWADGGSGFEEVGGGATVLIWAWFGDWWFCGWWHAMVHDVGGCATCRCATVRDVGASRVNSSLDT